jgi:hypothetical protein
MWLPPRSRGTQVCWDVIETTHRDVQTVTWPYLHTKRGRTGHTEIGQVSSAGEWVFKFVLESSALERTEDVSKLIQRMAGTLLQLNWAHQCVIFPLTCYKTHMDLNMDDVALCHIIIVIIITLSRWSRNTLSTQSIPSCTTHSVKLNTGTRPDTGHPCQHLARV